MLCWGTLDHKIQHYKVQQMHCQQSKLTPAHPCSTSSLKMSNFSRTTSLTTGSEIKCVKEWRRRADVTSTSIRVRAEITPARSFPTITKHRCNTMTFVSLSSWSRLSQVHDNCWSLPNRPFTRQIPFLVETMNSSNLNIKTLFSK